MNGFTVVDKCVRETKIIAILTFTLFACVRLFSSFHIGKNSNRKNRRTEILILIRAHDGTHMCQCLLVSAVKNPWKRTDFDMHEMSNDLAVQQYSFLLHLKFYVIDDAFRQGKSWGFIRILACVALAEIGGYTQDGFLIVSRGNYEGIFIKNNDSFESTDTSTANSGKM